MVSFTLWLLYHWGKTAWYKLNMWLDGTQNQSLVTPRERGCIEFRREREWGPYNKVLEEE
jgi:hypothetical protein